MKLIDLSQKIENDMPVYPGDSSVTLNHSNIYERDKYNNHWLGTGMHAGTHVDGLMHMLDVSSYICDVDLNSFYGEGCIIHTQNQDVITYRSEYENIVRQKSIVLIHTGMDCCYGQATYYNEHAVLDISFCELLARKEVKMVGFDMPSPDRYPFEVHKYLLSHNIYILENLKNLDKINEYDKFEIMAFPLKIKADSCMVRAVAKIL
jgi:kynurenine formamidase